MQSRRPKKRKKNI